MDHEQTAQVYQVDRADQHPTYRPPLVKPTPAAQRFGSIDTLRGFALLGILLPNIIAFAWPMGAMTDYTVMGDTPANAFGHTITSTVFLGKFMFLFAMLFGSGVIMYARKFDTADETGQYHSKLRRGAALWYSRCAWLLLFGMMHAYLLWYGDILTFYAVAGLTALWWIRRLDPKVQFFGGLILYYLGIILMIAFSALGYWAVYAGKIEITELSADPAIEIAAYTGTYFDAFKARIFTVLLMEFLFIPLMLPALWGIMAMGMGLTRMGILTGEKPTRFYIKAAIILLGIGIPLTGFGYVFTESTFDLVPGFMWQSIAQPVGVPLALGYAALVIALSKWSPARIICIPLAAVGRMALTNYFLQTILCTTFFYGYGLGNFATIPYPQLLLVILSVWTINFTFSILWLHFFTMGPFEWLWRVLTYRQIVPIRIQTQRS
jgi:uncharacterized protein